MTTQDDAALPTTPSDLHSSRPPRPKKPKAGNPISVAVQRWTALPQVAQRLQAVAVSPTALVDSAPKRWVVYEPMALLPSGSFASDDWRVVLDERLADCADGGGDDASAPGGEMCVVGDGASPRENILRSPSGLRILYGDFGPGEALLARSPQPPRRDCGDNDDKVEEAISDRDFDLALWVSTKQNGIYQTWAPRWTMFSRGNVKEKARLLAFHDNDQSSSMRGSTAAPPWAVDLYAGIGYFVFSYAKLGMRVLCWEVNPWSVEGLRRGARRNGWKIKVVRGRRDLARPTPDLIDDDDRIVVFLESNVEAARRLRELRSSSPDDGVGFSKNVLHVNCGFLPASQPSWEGAVDIVRSTEGSWLHLHENVADHDISERGKEIETLITSHIDQARASDGDDLPRRVALEHTELRNAIKRHKGYLSPTREYLENYVTNISDRLPELADLRLANPLQTQMPHKCIQVAL
ncbi:tRNA wybutosine-synthesizing protein 2 [Pyricularia oryzae 70-15]|uniref:tRNA(Phe) (4-demethylwyosine(37)-C(7)) aminocarboxypropyltransferase n=1 Tax=Pyricularia oryzae (strain 70-15 / ATCC MYA-4617 / FGSC 8958) TaxID=242507 RepID=G4NH67_PYRO7|nr:tRNA wybutosine-synthesizing protein 2 [Pyricularia oryzae 70-15]EHA47577.1 tRNA wybutosine-synthesizing protein 2 [Pyricularia oryzae 70-15]